jgi:ABC-type uncharacterized transport system ATPase component
VDGFLALKAWLLSRSGFGSLFAEQIRAAQSSYPFLEVVGEAGAGKSTLIEFCGNSLVAMAMRVLIQVNQVWLPGHVISARYLACRSC